MGSDEQALCTQCDVGNGVEASGPVRYVRLLPGRTINIALGRKACETGQQRSLHALDERPQGGRGVGHEERVRSALGAGVPTGAAVRGGAMVMGVPTRRFGPVPAVARKGRTFVVVGGSERHGAAAATARAPVEDPQQEQHDDRARGVSWKTHHLFMIQCRVWMSSKYFVTLLIREKEL